jgi:CRP-like cAMP-binding protein
VVWESVGSRLDRTLQHVHHYDEPRKEATVSTLDGRVEFYELLARGQRSPSFEAGEVIFMKGDPGDAMYLVREGSVAIRNEDRIIEMVEAPGMFGEMAVIEREPRSLTAVAASDVTLVEIPVQQFWTLVDEAPYFARLVMSVMAARLRRRDSTT